MGQLTLARMLEAFVGGVVGLNVSHLAVADLALAPGAAISESAAEVALRAELLAAPSDSYNAPVVRRACAAPAVTPGDSSRAYYHGVALYPLLCLSNHVCKSPRRTLLGPAARWRLELALECAARHGRSCLEALERSGSRAPWTTRRAPTPAAGCC